ncbi:hypothetical protein OPKNFCMD_4732 [Methylobacterium crusticola]|uniref:Uncharacterized protein n=1 Tax=Methylobacterium crusticola TaxID=1697972 RepID=A0ABQ4R2Y0_9HYPH|nr:hypothetical protein OPKNFCMD_4732 [Methylobacterium crusticola]
MPAEHPGRRENADRPRRQRSAARPLRGGAVDPPNPAPPGIAAPATPGVCEMRAAAEEADGGDAGTMAAVSIAIETARAVVLDCRSAASGRPSAAP